MLCRGPPGRFVQCGHLEPRLLLSDMSPHHAGVERLSLCLYTVSGGRSCLVSPRHCVLPTVVMMVMDFAGRTVPVTRVEATVPDVAAVCTPLVIVDRVTVGLLRARR